jgi:ribosomal protein S18 acetylase RimI-like enzyme
LLEDEAFLFQLYASTRREEYSTSGWTEEQLEALLRMQYEGQKASYRSRFPQAVHRIVVYGETRIGRIITDEGEQAVRLIDISLLPAFRGQGIGTKLLKQVQRVAAGRGASVQLHVLKGNPAQRLYARCGFSVTGEEAPYIAMQWDSRNAQNILTR